MTDWWLSGGINSANVLAVYSPFGAADYSASLSNLANPGTYDAAAGTAPSWSATAGWTFNGSTQYLRCNGLNAPNTAAWSFLVWFKSISGTTGVILGATDSVTVSYLYMSPQWSSTTARWYHDSNTTNGLEPASSNKTEGIMGMAGSTGYMNGVSAGSIGSGGGNNGWEIYLGARNNRGTAANFVNGSILRVAIYNTVITADQVKEVSRAMRDLVVGFGDSIVLGTYYVAEAEKFITIVCTAKVWEKQNSGIGSTTVQNTTQNQVAVIGGAVTNNGRDRYVADVQNYSPQWVLILYGLNDLRLNDGNFTTALYENDLGEIVSGLITSGVTANHIVIGAPPYIPEASYALYSPWNGGSLSDHAAHVASAKAVADAYGTLYVDVYQWMVDNGGDSLIGADGIHPNVDGHEVIANAFLSVLTSAKNRAIYDYRRRRV